MINECAWRCSNVCTKVERGADGVRQTPQHDQCIPSGLNRSTVLRSRFAKVSGKTSRANGGAADTMRYRRLIPDAACDADLEPALQTLRRAIMRGFWRKAWQEKRF